LLDFGNQVFDVVELERNKLPNGFHVQARIGDSVIVLSPTDPPYKEAAKASIHVCVEDVEATYKRAMAAVATSLDSPRDQPWQGRGACVKDSFGNVWYIETYKGPK
jgi:PhnB protein